MVKSENVVLIFVEASLEPDVQAHLCALQFPSSDIPAGIRMVSSLVIRVYIAPRPSVGTLHGIGRRRFPSFTGMPLEEIPMVGGTATPYKRDGRFRLDGSGNGLIPPIRILIVRTLKMATNLISAWL